MKFRKLNIDIGGYDLYVEEGADYDLVRQKILQLNRPIKNVSEDDTVKTLRDLFNMK